MNFIFKTKKKTFETNEKSDTFFGGHLHRENREYMSFIFDTNDAYIYIREYTDETLEFCGKIKKPEEM